MLSFICHNKVTTWSSYACCSVTCNTSDVAPAQYVRRLCERLCERHWKGFAEDFEEGFVKGLAQ